MTDVPPMTYVYRIGNGFFFPPEPWPAPPPGRRPTRPAEWDEGYLFAAWPGAIEDGPPEIRRQIAVIAGFLER